MMLMLMLAVSRQCIEAAMAVRTHQALKGASHHSSRQQSDVNSNRCGVLR